MLSIASFILSIIAIGVSTGFALRQARLMKSANTFPVLVDFFREFRSPEFRDSQRVIYQRLPDCSPDVGLYALPSDIRGHVISTIQYYDNLGAMVANGLVGSDLVLGVLGESIERFWNLIESFLKKEREIRGDTEYEIFFEHLAALAAPEQGRQARAKLRLLRRSSAVQ